jgi:quercetin dioxygenase-like cupin family protein
VGLGASPTPPYGLVESWIPAGSSPPLHVHRLEDEAFYVLEGQVRFVSGDTEVLAGPGSFVFAPRDVPHTFVVGATRRRMS